MFQKATNEIQQNTPDESKDVEKEENADDYLDSAKNFSQVLSECVTMKTNEALLENNRQLINEIKEIALEKKKDLLKTLEENKIHTKDIENIRKVINDQFNKVDDTIKSLVRQIETLKKCNEQYKVFIKNLNQIVSNQQEEIKRLKNQVEKQNQIATEMKVLTEQVQPKESLNNSVSNLPITNIETVANPTSLENALLSSPKSANVNTTLKKPRNSMATFDKSFSTIAKHDEKRSFNAILLKLLYGLEVSMMVAYILPQQLYTQIHMSDKTITQFKEKILLGAIIVGLSIILIQNVPLRKLANGLKNKVKPGYKTNKNHSFLDKKELQTDQNDEEEEDDGDGQAKNEEQNKTTITDH